MLYYKLIFLMFAHFGSAQPTSEHVLYRQGSTPPSPGHQRPQCRLFNENILDLDVCCPIAFDVFSSCMFAYVCLCRFAD